MSIQLTVLGAGSAFNFEAGNVAYLIETGKATVLIDCGFTVPQALKELGKLDAVTHIFISHTHADHVGGLEPLAQWRYFVSQRQGQGIPAPKLVVTPDILDRLRHLEALGLANIQDDWGRPLTATLETYFDIEVIGVGSPYRVFGLSTPWDKEAPEAYRQESLEVRAYPTVHVPGNFPSYSFEVTASVQLATGSPKQKNVWLTCDTRTPFDYRFGMDVDLLIHDCQLFKGPNEGAGDVHANIFDLGLQLKPETKANTWLVHYGANRGPAWAKAAFDYGFAGFVDKGQTFDLLP